jgi:hypothetical protein
VHEGGSRPEGSSRPSTAGGSGGRESAVTPPATPTAAAASPGAGAGAGAASTAAAAATASTGTGTSAGSRSYNSGFAQAARDRDERRDERGGYEDSGTEGNGVSREDTSDGNNFNDGEGGVPGIDGGASGNVASGQRQGSSRGSRLTRQIVERRERDSRREGKWERKQT